MDGMEINMKRILFLIHDLGQGGAEKVLVNLVNNMDHIPWNMVKTEFLAILPFANAMFS